MDHRHVSLLLAVVGAILTGSAAWHFQHDLAASAEVIHLLGHGVLVGGSGLGLLYGAYWHWVHELPRERYPRILGWVVASAVLFTGTALVSLYMGSNLVTTEELFEVLYLSVSVGSIVGTVGGSHEARAITRAKAAASDQARAEAREAEQERLEQLNGLLRHYVLNGVSVIDGYVDQLRDEVPASEHPKLDAIEDRTRTMTTLVEHVRTLSKADREDATRPVDLAAAVERANDDVDGCGISVETRDHVRATDTLDDGLYHLITAIERITDSEESVTLACERADGRVVLTATAPGSLPEQVEATMFEPVGSGIGLDLYLAKTLLDSFGELRRVNGIDDAIQFELELHVVEDP